MNPCVGVLSAGAVNRVVANGEPQPVSRDFAFAVSLDAGSALPRLYV